MSSTDTDRPLSDVERALARWMLENGTPDAEPFLRQLEEAQVTPWRCECGCASINFQTKRHPPAPPGVHILGDYLCGEVDAPAGAFIFESGGVLAGIEFYSLAVDAPSVLPEPPLRPFGERGLRPGSSHSPVSGIGRAATLLNGVSDSPLHAGGALPAR